MYDPKAEAQEFVGIDRNDAVVQATQYFEAEEAELSITVWSEGVNGLAGRTVAVAALKDRPAPAPRRDDREDRGRRDDRRDRGRGGRDRDRDRDRGRDRGRGRGGREERAERVERVERVEPEEPSGPSVGTAQGDLTDIGQFVLGVLERLEAGPFDISESEEGSIIALEIKGEAALRLASGDGRPVDALQLIANQAAAQADPDTKRIVLDIEGNADARESFLTRLAERVVKRAQDGGRSVALDPMNGRDRRMIHIAVREIEGVVTMSKGEGRYRQVVVVPEGAPEYEEAQEQAESAGDRG